MTFALARLSVLVVGAVLHGSGLMDMKVRENKLTTFYACSYAAAAICMGSCEIVAQQLRSKASRKSPKPQSMA